MARKFTKYPSNYVKSSRKYNKKRSKEIYEYLDLIGGYDDYDGKVESLMEDFGLTQDEAEGYVWNHTTGLDRLNGLR